MPLQFPDVRAIFGGISRGAPMVTTPGGCPMPFAGVDQGDGTVAMLTTTTSSGSNHAIVTSQTAVTQTPTQITSGTPPTTRTSVIITNNGTGTVWIGTSTVTSTTGLPLFQGATITVALGSSVGIWAITTAQYPNASVAVMEIS